MLAYDLPLVGDVRPQNSDITAYQVVRDIDVIAVRGRASACRDDELRPGASTLVRIDPPLLVRSDPPQMI